MKSFWEIKNYKNKNLLLLNIKILCFLNSTTSVFLKKLIIKIGTILNNFNLKQSNKVIFQTKFNIKKYETNFVKNKLIFKKSNLHFDKSNFYFFIKMNTWLINKKLKVHHSFTNYYYYSSPNIGILSLGRMLNLWNNITLFINNIFFFKINYIIFSNIYFKYETLSLNWSITKHLSFLWRYSNFFFFFTKNKATFYVESFFRFLLSRGFNLSFIVDLNYHKTSLFYLNKFRFISVGPVPLSSSLYSISIALPVSSNSIFSNLFFIRFLIKLNKLNRKTVWLGYNRL